jgi:DNA repair protein RecN (Recombination protein N)
MPKVRLVELSARSLGVIANANLEFGEGFCVITGETGAGKTLLLGALELCLGGDGAQSRHGVTSDTQVSVVFAADNSEIVLAREASASGRLRATLNGLASNAEALRNAAEPLIVIHGQHDSLALKSKLEILRLVDNYGGVDSSEFQRLTREIASLNRLRESAGGDEAGRQREYDFLQFQLNEILESQIVDENELSDLLEKLQALSEAREGQSAVIEVVGLLNDSDDSVLDAFAAAINRIPKAEAYLAVRQTLSSSLEVAREGVRDLSALADPEAFDPVQIDQLESRALVLQNLIRKYGLTLADVITKAEDLETAVREHGAAIDRLATVEEDLSKLEVLANAEATRLLGEREAAAERLSGRIRAQLERVALPHATLRFSISGPAGSSAEILFAPNPGQPEGPLQSLASGGELSRVLLAISLETTDSAQVAVFDEVDAGIGGQVAQQIGDCLREVGTRQQVLAVTHLASVAAKADKHFVIEKRVDEGQTVTSVREVSGPERVREVARMLAGEVNEAALALAEHLLQGT